MADMTVEDAAKQYNTTKTEVTQEVKQVEPVQGPRIIEGNTGTLSVMILDQINHKLGIIVEFIAEIKQEKV